MSRSETIQPQQRSDILVKKLESTLLLAVTFIALFTLFDGCSKSEQTTIVSCDFIVICGQDLFFESIGVSSRDEIKENYPVTFVDSPVTVDSIVKLMNYSKVVTTSPQSHSAVKGIVYFYSDFKCIDSLEFMEAGFVHGNSAYMEDFDLRKMINDLKYNNQCEKLRTPSDR